MSRTRRREVTLKEALLHARSRTIDEDREVEGFTQTTFTDGSRIIAESVCNGAYSEVTPDCDLQPPRFWVEES